MSSYVNVVSPVSPEHFIRDCPQAKCQVAPQAEGGSQKQIDTGGGQGQSTSLSTCTASASIATSSGGSKVKEPQEVPYLNPDPFKRFIGPKNWGEAKIGELTTCLLDNGAQLNFMTLTYALRRGLTVMSLDCLTREVGGTLPPI